MVPARAEERRFGPRAPGQRRLAIIAGLFFAADLVAWHYAIQMVGAGLATVLGNTQVVFVAVAAWLFFGERLTARLIGALVIALSGVVLISGVLGGEAYGENPVAGSSSACSPGRVRRVPPRPAAGQPRSPPPGRPLMDATASSAVASAAAGLVLARSACPSWPSLGWLVILALSAQVVGYLLISVALPRLPSALTSIVLLIQPVAAVGWPCSSSARPSPTQLLGVDWSSAGWCWPPPARLAAGRRRWRRPRRALGGSAMVRAMTDEPLLLTGTGRLLDGAGPRRRPTGHALALGSARAPRSGGVGRSPDAAPATDRWEDLGGAS